MIIFLLVNKGNFLAFTTTLEVKIRGILKTKAFQSYNHKPDNIKTKLQYCMCYEKKINVDATIVSKAK